MCAAVTDRRDVLFVGAGLSAAFGYALTSEILPEIMKRLRARELFDRTFDNEAADLRFEIEGLLRVFMPGLLADDTGEMPAITDVLSLLDH
jgi:hypothetical protein